MQRRRQPTPASPPVATAAAATSSSSSPGSAGRLQAARRRLVRLRPGGGDAAQPPHQIAGQVTQRKISAQRPMSVNIQFARASTVFDLASAPADPQQKFELFSSVESCQIDVRKVGEIVLQRANRLLNWALSTGRKPWHFQVSTATDRDIANRQARPQLRISFLHVCRVLYALLRRR